MTAQDDIGLLEASRHRLPQATGEITIMIAAVLTLALSALVAHTIYSWYRLSHVPGPFWPSVSIYWNISQTQRGQQPHAVAELNEKYGPLVRIGPNELATDDPEVIRRMMAIRSGYTRAPCMSLCPRSILKSLLTMGFSGYRGLRFEPGKDHLFSQRDEVAHMKLRNKMAAGVSLAWSP
jgi:hypothetical protein